MNISSKDFKNKIQNLPIELLILKRKKVRKDQLMTTQNCMI